MRIVFKTLVFLSMLVVSQARAVDYVDYHNIIRDALSQGQTLSNLGPYLNQTYNFSLENQPATPLSPFTESSAAQASAAAYAAQCKFTHSGIPGYGENLFAGSTSFWTLQNAINSWADEARYLSYPINAAVVSCQTGEQCGHYTQMVWSSTTAVGCAVQSCTSISDGSNILFGGNSGTMIVCHYTPPGNVSPNGVDIYAPYVGQSSGSGGGSGSGSDGGSGTAIIPPILLLLLND